MKFTKTMLTWPTLALCTGAAGAQSNDEPRRLKDVEEVVVTAQKREERLQDVPISVAVLGGNSLDEPTVQGVAEALSRVPGVVSALTARGGGNTTQLVIRGVGPQNAGSSTAGYYLDSLPFGFIRNSFAPDSNPYDMNRIEVLRGPQGTLYGASALNGVVRVLTKDANLDELEMKARALTSNTDHGGWNYRGDMALNVPIVEGKLAARAVVGYQDLSGWIDKPIREDANDAEISNLRLKVNARPTEQFSVALAGWFSRADFGAPPNSADGRRTTSVAEEPASNDYDAFNAKLSYEFSGVTLTSATSYIDYQQSLIFDYAPFVPGTYTNTHNDAEIFAQEMTLNSNGEGPWRWSVGGIYRDAKETAYQDLLPILPRLLDSETTSESFAVFGELTRSFADGVFEVTAGLRYFEDDVSDTNNITSQSGSDTFDATTPRVVLTWHPGDQMTVYASYGEGFRSGLSQSFIVQRAAPAFPAMKPDTLMNYELGMKGGFLDGRGTFETAVFYIDWEDVQQSLGVQVSPSVLTTALVNGESASGAGFEAAATIEPIDGLTFSGSFSWNDLSLDSDVYSSNTLLFAKGDRLNFSPETTASAGADYAFPLGGNGFEGRFSISANYISKQSNRVIAGGLLSQDGDSLLLGRTAFEVTMPKNWSVTLFVDNVGNENGVGAEDPFLPVWDARLRPRTVGLQFDYQME